MKAFASKNLLNRAASKKSKFLSVLSVIGFALGMLVALVTAYPLLDRLWLYGLSDLGRAEFRGTLWVGIFSGAAALTYALVGAGRLRGWAWVATPWRILSFLGLVVGLVELALLILLCLAAESGGLMRIQ